MAVDLTIEMSHTSGELARLGDAFGQRSVNIEGMCAVTSGGPDAEVHVLVDDVDAALAALADAAIAVELEQEVVVVDVDDRPGVLGDVSRMLGDAGVNITLAYLATDTRLVLGADDLAAARAALDGLTA